MSAELKKAPKLASTGSLAPKKSFNVPVEELGRKNIDVADVKSILNGSKNPLTGRPYSRRYRKLLVSRKKLPAFAHMDQFCKMFNAHQIMIVVGETGAGKTTQLPQFVAHMDTLQGRDKMIACTQPRRVPTMCVAKRVAEEMDVKLGKEVGYTIRFENMSKPGTTWLKFLTDGTLLNEAMSDENLSQYGTIIIDEAHERTVDTDILIALLKGIAKRRPDLKIVIMSATLNARKFQEYFSTGDNQPLPPLLQIPGRSFPVQIFYSKTFEADYVAAVVRTTLLIHQSQDAGDILVFLNGQDEIENACRKIRAGAADASKERDTSKKGGPETLYCTPLYSALPFAQQQQALEAAPPGSRKVIVSTNVAETSLTIDGVVYVIDAGYSKQKSYDPRIGRESLLVHPISKASAQQRSGRAGRTRPGKCFRLYTEEYYAKGMEKETSPEILRSNLTSAVLQLINLGITDPLNFDYLDAPDSAAIMRALELLDYLSAIDVARNLTFLGQVMAKFPLDPQLARMLVDSAKFRCSNEILTIASMISVPNVWINDFERLKEAKAARKLLTTPDGDHLTLMNVYNKYITNKGDPDWCYKNFLSRRALQEAENIRQQLEKLMQRFDLKIVSPDNQQKLASSVREALVCGFFTQVAHRRGGGLYVTVHDQQIVSLFPSSSLKKAPEWVLFHEFVFTRQPYIRTVTEIKPEWLLEHASDYYDLAEFPSGAARQALERVINHEMPVAEGGQGKAKGEDKPKILTKAERKAKKLAKAERKAKAKVQAKATKKAKKQKT